MINKRNPAIMLGEEGMEYQNLPYYTAPDQDMPDDMEEQIKWAVQNVKYALTFYNRPLTSLMPGYVGGGEMNLSQRDYQYFPVQKKVRMMYYYLGKQNNLDYAFMTQGQGNSGIQPYWSNGQNISTFVDYFRGIFLSKISNAAFSALPISNTISEEMQDTYDFIRLGYEQKDALEDLKNQGVNISPANGKTFDDEREVQEYMDTDYKVEGANVCTDIANGIYFTNKWGSMFTEAIMHTIIAEQSMIEHYVDNGLNKERVIDPRYQFWDDRKDNDFGDFDVFRGYVMPMNPSELFRYPELTYEQVQDIKTMCADKSTCNSWNFGNFNFDWWIWDNTLNANSIQRCRVVWSCRRWEKFKKEKDKNGVSRIVGTAEKDGYYVDDLYQAEIIGNKYLVNYGLLSNVVESYSDVSKLENPLMRFRPNTFMRQSVSCVERIYRLQDEMDMYRFKIRETVGKAIGRTYIIWGDKLSKAVQELITDLKDMGMTVMVKDREEGKDTSRTVEMLDFTLDPNVDKFIALYDMCNKEMETILNTSKIAMGQAAQYIGQGTQNTAISQSDLSMEYLFNGFFDFMVRNMYYSANQLLALKTQREEDMVRMNCGDKGIVYIKFLKKVMRTWDTLMIKLSISDIIDKQEIKEMETLMITMLQNSANPAQVREVLGDVLELKTAKSFTQLKTMNQYKIKQDKKNAAIAAQEKQKQDMLAQQSQLQSTEKITADQMNAKGIIDQQNIRLKGDYGIMEALIAAKNNKDQALIDHILNVHQMYIEGQINQQQAQQQIQQQPTAAAPAQ